MEDTRMDPLKRLHKLQEEEFERYAYYKEKYTKDLLDADMPADRKERLMEGIEAAAKSNSISDYEKLKFDGVLSPTNRYLWTSLFKYIHDYSISYEEFQKIVETYYMPLPGNILLEEAFKNLPEHRWIKIQDDNGKSLYGPFEELGTQLDFSLIRYLQIQDDLFEELWQYFNKGNLDRCIAGLGARLRDNLIFTNCSFSQFMIKLFLHTTGDVPQEVKTYGNPDGVTLYHSEVFMSFINRATFYGLELENESPVNNRLLLDGIYSTVKIM